MKKIITILLFILSILTIPHDTWALTLQEGLSIVIEKARDIRISRYELEAERASIGLARSYQLPRIDIYANHTWLKYRPEALFGLFGPVPMGEKEYLTYGFRVRQLIYDFGRTGSSIDVSILMAEAKEEETRGLRNLIVLQFIESYISVLEAEKILRVAEDEVNAYEKHLEDTRAMFEAGLITENDLLQAKVLLSDARQRMIDAENYLRMTKSRLNTLLGRSIDEPVEVIEIRETALPDISIDTAYSEAVKNRPELLSIQKRIMALEEEINSVRAEYFPEIFVSGGYEYQENSHLVHEDNWSFVLGVNLNLSSGGATKSRINKLIHELKALKERRKKILDTVKLDVKQAYLDIQSSRHKLQVSRQAVEQAMENLRLERLRYKEGIGTATEVTDAVSLLSKARTNYWKAVYGLRIAEARFYFAMGRNLIGLYATENKVQSQYESMSDMKSSLSVKTGG